MNRKVTALILCGGKGERLRPLTSQLPKPLIRLKGRPILSYLIDHLEQYGIRDIVIAAGFKAGKLQEFFGANHRNLSVKIIDSGDVDIVERIKSCSSEIEGDFIMLYGDTLANVNLDALQDFHFSHNLKATITLWPLKSSFGLAEIDRDGNVVRFREKPTLDQWVNIGHFYFEQEVLTWIKEFSSYAVFLESMAANRQMKGFRHEGVHITVNTLRELEEAELNIDEFKFERPKR